ncbi:hypothetical protein [Nocardioides sp.]|uniref:hypothetical protein n=1 Tax=Nocardioides sp. TaxID=35761 RepID=UPI003564CEBB
MTERDLDAPTPPGGPQRTDAPDGDQVPGTPAPDPGPEVERVTKPGDSAGVAAGSSDAGDSGTSGEGPGQSDAAAEAQAENAETSLDQPST